jgi:hypothetical protein
MTGMPFALGSWQPQQLWRSRKREPRFTRRAIWAYVTNVCRASPAACLDNTTFNSLNVMSLGVISSPSSTHCALGSAATKGIRKDPASVLTVLQICAATDAAIVGSISRSKTCSGRSSALPVVLVRAIVERSETE